MKFLHLNDLIFSITIEVFKKTGFAHWKKWARQRQSVIRQKHAKHLYINPATLKYVRKQSYPQTNMQMTHEHE